MGSDGDRFVFFSGGTALNSCARELANLPGAKSVTHVLPVSDDGGSTAEIVRVLGGPAVGDIRSRCLRLASNATREQAAVNTLLGHRLDLDESRAKKEWYRVIEGEHDLWAGIENPYRQVLLSYLALFQMSLLRSSADPPFNFSNGSVGNFFFAGARTFFKSLEAAIFLYQKVSGIPEHCDVLPCVCTEDRLVLGAELRDGTVIRGQNEISHPLGQPADAPLPSPIRRVLYLAYEGQSHEHEIQMEANARMLKRLSEATCVVYGMGSLYTSLCPSLILKGVGEAIASKSGAGVRKMLLLNGWHDREIAEYTAVDCVLAVTSSLNRNSALAHAPRDYITHLVVPRHGGIYDKEQDQGPLAEMGIEVVVVASSDSPGENRYRYVARDLVSALNSVVLV